MSSKIFAGGLPKVTLLFGATHTSGKIYTGAADGKKITWIKHLNEEKYEIDQKFIFDFGIFYLPMTIKRSYAVK